MKLNTEDIEEYRKIYKKVYGEEISHEEALNQGTRLLNFFQVICSPTALPPDSKTEKKCA